MAKTCSYADIARAIGRPTAFRAVGQANHDNPLAIIVPCHRVLGANGTLTGYGGGLSTKEKLLRLEGAAFRVTSESASASVGEKMPTSRRRHFSIKECSSAHFCGGYCSKVAAGLLAGRRTARISSMPGIFRFVRLIVSLFTSFLLPAYDCTILVAVIFSLFVPNRARQFHWCLRKQLHVRCRPPAWALCSGHSESGFAGLSLSCRLCRRWNSRHQASGAVLELAAPATPPVEGAGGGGLHRSPSLALSAVTHMICRGGGIDGRVLAAVL